MEVPLERQPSPIVVRCFGDFRAEVNGEQVTRWRGGRTRSLFQYLLVNRDKVVLKDRLYEVLWPGTEWTSQSSSLKVAVHGLRAVLRGAAGDPRPLEVTYQDGGYVLRVNGAVWVDVDRFASLTERAHTAACAGDLKRAADLYSQAVALYRGDFLAAEDADWVEEQRQWLRGRMLRALQFLSSRALHQDDSASAVAYCRRTLEIEPLHEGTYRTLMVVHARRGELGQVKRWHDLCTRRLREYLDAPPAELTNRLLLRALRGEVAGALEAAVG